MVRPRNVILRSRLLPTNEEISAALSKRYQKVDLRHVGEDGLPLQVLSGGQRRPLLLHHHAAHQVDWRSKMRDNREWIQKNHPRVQPWAPWTMQEVFKVLGGYVYRFILNAMIKESRRLIAHGLSGLAW